MGILRLYSQSLPDTTTSLHFFVGHRHRHCERLATIAFGNEQHGTEMTDYDHDM